MNQDLTNQDHDTQAEAVLIDRIVAGKTQEFSVFVERYQAMVFGIIIRQVQSRDIAEELAQETFFKAFKL